MKHSPSARDCDMQYGFFNTAHSKEGADTVSINPIVISKHEPRLFIERHSLLELQDNPIHAGMSGHIEMKHFATRMIENHKDIQDLE